MIPRLFRLLLGFGLASLVLAAADRVERKTLVKRGDHFGLGRLEEIGGVRILRLSGWAEEEMKDGRPIPPSRWS